MSDLKFSRSQEPLDVVGSVMFGVDPSLSSPQTWSWSRSQCQTRRDELRVCSVHQAAVYLHRNVDPGYGGESKCKECVKRRRNADLCQDRENHYHALHHGLALPSENMKSICELKLKSAVEPNHIIWLTFVHGRCVITINHICKEHWHYDGNAAHTLLPRYHWSYLVWRYFTGFCGSTLDTHNNMQPGLSHQARVNWSKICESGPGLSVPAGIISWHPDTHSSLWWG